MKAKYISILTAVAAVATLASCNKDLNPGKVDTDQPAGTLRTITVSFGTSTKSSIGDYSDGGYPVYFSAGDSIMVSNGDACEKCVVFPKDKMVLQHPQMAIETSLEGPLTAVYPASAAILEGNAISPDVRVPSEQSGSFADANICMANQEAVLKSEDALVFTTKVAILRFYTKGFEVDSIRINSAGNPIASDKRQQITLVPKQPEVDTQAVAQQEMGKQVLTIEPDYWYAAIDVEQGGVAGKNLTFESWTKTQDTVVVKQSTSEVSLLANKMYNAFIPYYIKVQVGYDEEKGEPIIQRWGYCNIGAFEPEESGDYFMWGEVKGHKALFDLGADDAFKSDFYWFDGSTDPERYTGYANSADKGFHWANTPYCNYETPSATTLNKYNSTDNKTTLVAGDDAATIKWGDGWRMPTKEEFEKIINSYQQLNCCD
ncbi:MAG: hypothetical protein MJY55_04395 [Bacteroidales bacterium]|nr:hypothetical protein [Bacteroidales bacterium]